MLGPAPARITTESDREPASHTRASRRGRRAEVGMVETEALIREQAASGRLGVELGIHPVEERLIGHQATPLPIAVWPGDERNRRDAVVDGEHCFRGAGRRIADVQSQHPRGICVLAVKANRWAGERFLSSGVRA